MRSGWLRRFLGGPHAITAALNLILVPFLFWGLHSSDTDTFYHLASGRWMFEHGQVLDRETFSFTAQGRPWMNCYWLFQCILYGSFKLGGYAGVLILRGVVMVGTANLLLAWIRMRTGGARLETLTFGLLAFAMYLPRGLNVRGQIFSYLFLVILLWRLEHFMRGSRRFDLALPALCVLWANIHGVAFPVALGTIVVFGAAAFFPHCNRLIGDILRDPSLTRWIFMLAVCTLAFTANPFGFALLGDMFRALFVEGQEETLSQIAEMSPFSFKAFLYLTPDLDIWSIAILNWTLVLGIGLLAHWVSRVNVLALGCFAFGAGLALYKSRFVTEFGILAVPFIAAAVVELRNEGVLRGRRIGRALAAVCAYLVLAFLLKLGPAMMTRDAFEFVDGRIHPVGAARFLEEQALQGPLFCNPTMAGYVTWALDPSRVPVYMDMRAPIVFNAQEIWLYKAVGDTVSLEAFLRRYPVAFFLLERHAPLVGPMRAPNSGFAPIWVDQRFLLFARETLLVGREDLRLRTLDSMLRAESSFRLEADSDPQRLETEASRLASTWPGNHLAQASVFQARLALGHAEDALSHARSMADRFPQAGAYRFMQGLALERLGRIAEAGRAFAAARRSDPEFLPSYPALARLLALGESAEPALQVMEEYSKQQRYRLSVDDHLLLASLRHRRKALGAAADAYKRALWQIRDDDPRREETLCSLAAILLETGQANAAFGLLERVSSPAADLVRGRALAALGRADEARTLLLRLASRPDASPALRDLARAEAAR